MKTAFALAPSTACPRRSRPRPGAWPAARGRRRDWRAPPAAAPPSPPRAPRGRGAPGRCKRAREGERAGIDRCAGRRADTSCTSRAGATKSSHGLASLGRERGPQLTACAPRTPPAAPPCRAPRTRARLQGNTHSRGGERRERWSEWGLQAPWLVQRLVLWRGGASVGEDVLASAGASAPPSPHNSWALSSRHPQRLPAQPRHAPASRSDALRQLVSTRTTSLERSSSARNASFCALPSARRRSLSCGRGVKMEGQAAVERLAAAGSGRAAVSCPAVSQQEPFDKASTDLPLLLLQPVVEQLLPLPLALHRLNRGEERGKRWVSIGGGRRRQAAGSRKQQQQQL